MSYQTWSRPFDVHRVSDFPGVNDIAEALTEEIVDLRRGHGRGVRERKELFEHVRTIVLDLFVASHERAPAERRPVPRWLGVKLGKEAFAKKESRYNELFLSYRRTRDAIYALLELRYIRLVRGFYDRTKGIGRVTRIRARRKLLDLFEKSNVTVGHIKTEYKVEVIVLRDPDGNDIDYEDTAQTREWRANLERINAAIGKLRIRLKITDDDLFKLNRRMAN